MGKGEDNFWKLLQPDESYWMETTNGVIDESVIN